MSKHRAEAWGAAKHVDPMYVRQAETAEKVFGRGGFALSFGVAASQQYGVSRADGDSEDKSGVKALTTGTLAAVGGAVGTWAGFTVGAAIPVPFVDVGAAVALGTGLGWAGKQAGGWLDSLW